MKVTQKSKADTDTTLTGPRIKKTVMIGVIVLLVFVGSFFLWSIVSDLESAAIAPGKIVVESYRKSIQHLEGGIVSKIFVKEGGKVKKGEPLLELERTQAESSLNLLQGQVFELMALEARLIAERDQQNEIAWPTRLLEFQSNPNVRKIMDGQEDIFKYKKEALDGQLKILDQRVEQLKNEIESLDAQVVAEDKQLKLIEEEIVAVAYLEERKLIEKPRLLALKREAARLTGNRGEHLGLIARAKQRIGETEQQIITLKVTDKKETLDTLRDAQAKLSDILEREKSAEDIFKRTIIYSPQSGTVVGLTTHTIGGVIKPGEVLMDIVPGQDNLIIEARVNPMDIDIVRPGLIAKVRLSAYKYRRSPILTGEVTHISPDSFYDQNTHQTYYQAKINISPDQLQHVKHLMIYPGMPVEVMIITEKQTPFRYFITPITSSFEKAFRED